MISIYLDCLQLWLLYKGFPGGSDGKESTCSAGDLGSIPGLERSLGGGHGNPLQYSCLENPHGQRSLAGFSPWGFEESDTTEQLKQMYTVHTQKLLSSVAQSCPALCNLMNCSPARLLCPWGSSRQEYWSRLPCPPPGDLPTQGSNLGLLHYRWILLSEPSGKPKNTGMGSLSCLQWIFPTQEPNRVSCIEGSFFTNWAIREVQVCLLL